MEPAGDAEREGVLRMWEWGVWGGCALSGGVSKRFEKATGGVEGKDESSGGSPSAVGCELLDAPSTPTRWRGASTRERKRSTMALTNAVWSRAFSVCHL